MGKLLSISIVFAVAAATGVQGAAPEHHVDARLIAGDPIADGASALWVGLKMRHDSGWHTYWINPGDAGMPTKISWALPEGWTASGINWPAPERMQIGPLASYGYEGDVVLPLKLFPPTGWSPKQPVHLNAHAKWLVCKEQCIPEEADLKLNLPVRASAADRNLLETWRARIPQSTRFSTAAAERANGRLLLTLEPAGAGQFFPEHEELIEPGDPPQIAVQGERVTWSAKLGVQGKALAAPSSIAGVWVPKTGKPVFVEARLK